MELTNDNLHEIFKWLPSYSWYSVLSVCHRWYDIGSKIFKLEHAEQFRDLQLAAYSNYIKTTCENSLTISLDPQITTCVFCLHSCYYPILISYSGYIMRRGSKYYLDIYDVSCLKCHNRGGLSPIRNHIGVKYHPVAK